MAWFDCPFLGGRVELTAEREQHIRSRHANVLEHEELAIRLTLEDPDAVFARAWRPGELLFWRAFDELAAGREIVVVTIEDEPTFARSESAPRYWIVTAYQVRSAPVGECLWERT